MDAQTFCKSIGYTLLRIDSSAVADSFLNLVEFAPIAIIVWINGKANADGTWKLVDPNGLNTFINVTTATGACLSYGINVDFVYMGLDCEAMQPFVCEKQIC